LSEVLETIIQDLLNCNLKEIFSVLIIKSLGDKSMESVVAVFIPIIITLVIGLVIITYFYLRSRERQMLIDKGLSAEQIKEFFDKKKDNLNLFKTGIIILFFGLGLGFGMMLEDSTNKEYWIPFGLFVMTGIGFVVSNLVARKMMNKEE
jgi:hypothetical protein